MKLPLKDRYLKITEGLRLYIVVVGSRGKRGGRAGCCRTDNADALTNPQVDTGASSLGDDRGSSPLEATNEPARESGSLHFAYHHQQSI
ncbi:hypothetical protein T10_9921 [Trichinella papuae]|uniref:Uncharacterized protein n=1 Tax=Trichinella papuae TaxID=268474 RepID=A0A0V1MAD3_9BILA|nr:hypothetical protein T10_9921 [Trichinella papuae]